MEFADTADAVVGFRSDGLNRRNDPAAEPSPNSLDLGAQRRTRIDTPTASDDGPL
jgi:hypothetical protein